ALEIEGMGISQSEYLFADNLIKSPADIVTLKKDDLLGRVRVGKQALEKLESSGQERQPSRWLEQSAGQLIAAIDAKRKPPLDRFLYALGIRHIGEVTARDLARRYRTWSAFREMVKTAIAARADVKQ